MCNFCYLVSFPGEEQNRAVGGMYAAEGGTAWGGEDNSTEM